MAYQEDTKVAHINGYNLVPKEHLTHPEHSSRLSIYPESYAWATWDRAWQKYDDNLTWAKNASVKDIKKICGSTIGALRWKQNFGDAAAERIDTWAYRWLASMWEQNWLMVSPNMNIASYQGWAGGTHTRRKQRWVELPVEKLTTECFTKVGHPSDASADEWLRLQVFDEKVGGLLRGLFATGYLNFLKFITKLITKERR